MYKMVSMVILTLCLIITPFLIHAEVYKWVDEKGTVNFSDDYSKIPEKYLPVTETQWLPKDNSPQLPKETPHQLSLEVSPSKIEDKPTPPHNPQEPELLPQKIQRMFSGVISKVDDRERTIFVTGNGEGRAFSVFKDTKIKTDYGVDVSFDKLRTAMSVMVEYVEYMENRDDIDTLSVRISTMRRGFGEKQREEQKKQKDKQNVTAVGSKNKSKK